MSECSITRSIEALAKWRLSPPSTLKGMAADTMTSLQCFRAMFAKAGVTLLPVSPPSPVNRNIRSASPMALNNPLLSVPPMVVNIWGEVVLKSLMWSLVSTHFFSMRTGPPDSSLLQTAIAS